MASRNLTVFIADLKGFTPKTAASSRQELNEMLARFRKLITPVIERCGGHVVKELGDAFMVTFESPTNAVAAGALLQRLLGDRNAGVAEAERIEVRVAIHCGDVEVSANDIIGDAVNVASRVEGVAEVGEVYFTEAIFLTMNRSEVPSAEVGERVLKGIDKPIKLYRVLQDPADERYLRLLAGQPLEGAEAKSRRRSRMMLGLIVVLLLAIGGLAFAAYYVYYLPVSRARSLMKAGHYAEAVESLTRSYDKKVPDAEALDLIVQAANKAIDARVEANDFAGARELACKWCKRWSSLRELPVTVALAEAKHLVANDQAQAAADAVRTAAKDYDDWRLRLELSRLYARKDVYLREKGKRPHWGKYDLAVEEIHQAIRLLPPGQPMPAEVAEELWKRFRDQPIGIRYSSSERFYNKRVRELAIKHLLPGYREKMVAGCVSDDDSLRANSYHVLTTAKKTEGVDFIVYHCRNLNYYWQSKQQLQLSEDYIVKNAKTDADRKRAIKVLSEIKARLENSKSSTDKRKAERFTRVLQALGVGK
jgi:class 3 adenylate cyclase